MPSALICTQADFSAELADTLLWRNGFERHLASRLEDARTMAIAARPDIVLVDGELPRADALLAQLRSDPATRNLSLVVIARGDFGPAEVALLEAGANAILRLPPGPEWDERLTRLMQVPARKEARFPVQFAIEATVGPGLSIAALAVNVSLHGILMESNIAVSVGDELALLLWLPDGADEFTGAGRVVRQATAKQYGVEFQRLDGDGPERVLRFVGGRAAGH
jgi:DNA-binding response OmpR family regulator